jgi:hypothetical protein
MKKILTILMLAALVLASPANIFAEDQELTQNTTSGTVQLTASKASTYTVKLPTSVDVSANSATFTAYIKGDVDGAKKLVIAEDKSKGTNVLKNNAVTGRDVDLTISVDKSIDGSDITSEYASTGITITVSHADIAAGTYTCDLPLTISLADI